MALQEAKSAAEVQGPNDSSGRRKRYGMLACLVLVLLYLLWDDDREMLVIGKAPVETADDVDIAEGSAKAAAPGAVPIADDGFRPVPGAVDPLSQPGRTKRQRSIVTPAPPTPAPFGKGNAKVLHYYRNMTLDQVYGDKDSHRDPNNEALCELNLIYTGNCRIEQGQETWKECVARIGAHKLDRILNTRCKRLPVWKQLLLDDATGTEEGWKELRRGWVYDVETYTDDQTIPYVPPEKRTIAKYQPPRRCSSGCYQHPISFSVPQGNVAKRVSRDKWWGFVPYVPGTFPFGGDPKYHFGYQDEWLKDQLHQHSFFAWSHKRGGWDCMRHLEILSAGAIPYFADLELCPRMSLSHMPKELIKEAMALPGLEHIGQIRRHEERMDNEFMIRNPNGHVNFKRPGSVKFEKFDREAYFEIADRILNHTRHHMTTAATVAYVLRTIGYEEPKHVIMIGRWTYDYLHQTVESGLSDLGIKTTVLGHTTDWVLKKKYNAVDGGVPEDEMEKFRLEQARNSGHAQIPGLAWFYGFRNLPHVTRHSHKDRHDNEIKKRILAGEFDLVIYTYTENEPMQRRWYWSEIERAIPKERRVFLHHNDDVGDPDYGSGESCKHGWLFKREMHDVGC
jgi:hypothetical protein